MDIFSSFIHRIFQRLGANIERALTLQEIQFVIQEMNGFLYTNYEGIGYTEALEMTFEYLSEFHKFWAQHHKAILNPRIDDKQCELAAQALHRVYIDYNKEPFYELYDTCGLSKSDICRVRYFSANQDFRGSRNFHELADIFNSDPSLFDLYFIKDNPEDFLKHIGVTQLSQNDKRATFAASAAKLLIDHGIGPYELLEYCSNDLDRVRQLLLANRGSGYGKKKTDMFLRDMVVLKVWDSPLNFDKVDVASDINTVKVALRSGILKTDIMMLSSFLDIFCYQYSLVDEMNATAWRRVWEIWKLNYPTECVESPCLIDYLVYRIIGKDFCRETLCRFECETGEHTFYWHSGRNRTCQVCVNSKPKRQARVVEKILPCTHDKGHIALEKSPSVVGINALLPGIKECPFTLVCLPRRPEFKKYNPPKSISIMGQTGWISSYTHQDEGGGGLMA